MEKNLFKLIMGKVLQLLLLGFIALIALIWLNAMIQGGVTPW